MFKPEIFRKKPVFYDFTRMSREQIEAELSGRHLEQRYSQALADARVLSKEAEQMLDKHNNVVHLEDFRK